MVGVYADRVAATVGSVRPVCRRLTVTQKAHNPIGAAREGMRYLSVAPLVGPKRPHKTIVTAVVDMLFKPRDPLKAVLATLRITVTKESNVVRLAPAARIHLLLAAINFAYTGVSHSRISIAISGQSRSEVGASFRLDLHSRKGGIAQHFYAALPRHSHPKAAGSRSTERSEYFPA